MDLSHTLPKLLDAEHAWGRKFQTEKSTLEVHGHISTWSSSKISRFASISPFDAFEINSHVMFVVEDLSY